MQTFFCPHYLPKFEEFVCGLLDFQRKSIHFNVRINCSFLLALDYVIIAGYAGKTGLVSKSLSSWAVEALRKTILVGLLKFYERLK